MFNLRLDDVEGKIVEVALIHLAGNRNVTHREVGDVEAQHDRLGNAGRELVQNAVHALNDIDEPDVQVGTPVEIDPHLGNTLAGCRLDIVDIVDRTDSPFDKDGYRLLHVQRPGARVERDRTDHGDGKIGQEID